jgi:hypothetical protein
MEPRVMSAPSMRWHLPITRVLKDVEPGTEFRYFDPLTRLYVHAQWMKRDTCGWIIADVVDDEMIGRKRVRLEDWTDVQIPREAGE